MANYLLNFHLRKKAFVFDKSPFLVDLLIGLKRQRILNGARMFKRNFIEFRPFDGFSRILRDSRNEFATNLEMMETFTVDRFGPLRNGLMEWPLGNQTKLDLCLTKLNQRHPNWNAIT